MPPSIFITIEIGFSAELSYSLLASEKRDVISVLYISRTALTFITFISEHVNKIGLNMARSLHVN